MGAIRSPHSIWACSLLSTTMSRAAATAASSISCFCGKLDPAAFRWVPGSSHLPSKTGAFAVVMVVMMSAPSTTARGSGAGRTGTWSAASISRQKAARRAASRPYARTSRTVRTAQRA